MKALVFWKGPTGRPILDTTRLFLRVCKKWTSIYLPYLWTPFCWICLTFYSVKFQLIFKRHCAMVLMVLLVRLHDVDTNIHGTLSIIFLRYLCDNRYSMLAFMVFKRYSAGAYRTLYILMYGALYIFFRCLWNPLHSIYLGTYGTIYFILVFTGHSI
jgi:hypothetical protein